MTEIHQEPAGAGEQSEAAPPPRKRRRWKMRILTLTITLLGVLLAAEVVLRVGFPLTFKTETPDGRTLDWQASKPYACRVGTLIWEVDFAENATPKEIEDWDSGVPTVNPEGTKFFRHEVRGWDCDSHFRGRHKAPKGWKTSTKLKIVAVGDSFTFGSDVKVHESWPHHLERGTRGAEVLNCGVPGYGVDQIALKLDEYGPQLKPDIVVWGLISYNVLRAGKSWFPKSWMPKPILTIEGDSWTVTPPRTRAQVHKEVTGWRQSRVILAARAGVDLLQYSGWVKECTERFRHLVRITKARVEAWGGRLIIVYIPTGGPVLRTDDERGEEQMALCRELGVEVVDVRAAIRAMNLPESRLSKLTLRPEGRGHYSAAGNALVAQAVRAHLQSSKKAARSKSGQ